MKIIIVECCGATHDEGPELPAELRKAFPAVDFVVESWEKSVDREGGFAPEPYKGKFDAMIFAERVGKWNEYPAYGWPPDDEKMRKAYCGHNKPLLILDNDLMETERHILCKAWIEGL